jgi:hypothetical protein
MLVLIVLLVIVGVIVAAICGNNGAMNVGKLIWGLFLGGIGILILFASIGSLFH